jgi:hypothetical protein
MATGLIASRGDSDDINRKRDASAPSAAACRDGEHHDAGARLRSRMVSGHGARGSGGIGGQGRGVGSSCDEAVPIVAHAHTADACRSAAQGYAKERWARTAVQRRYLDCTEGERA